MRLDNEHVFCHGTTGHEPESKPVEYNENGLNSIGLKSGNGMVKENENRELCDLKVVEDDADRSPNLAPVGSPHGSAKMEAFQDSVFYMDKNVMEHDVPELIVCYREDTYQVVKDICIDEGVPLKDKFLFDTGAHKKNSCEFLPSERRMNRDMVKEKSELDKPIPDVVLKSSAEKQNVADGSSGEKGSKYALSLECDSNQLMTTESETDYCEINKAVDDVSKDISLLSLRDLLLMPEFGAKVTPPKSSNDTVDEVEQHSLQRPSEDAISETGSACEESENDSEETILARSTLVSADKKSDDGDEGAIWAIPTQDFPSEEAEYGHKEAASVSPTQISAAEESDNSRKEAKLASHALDSVSDESTSRVTDELSSYSNVETRNVASDSDSSIPTASGRESPQNGDSQRLGTQILSRFEDPNAEPFSGRLQYANGESSFSASGPLSGPISYSGPIPYSGSISLRSDSSTTSTRSFAFPVLQQEWNSSPVRMAKADRRRHFQKPKSWRQGLLCCRF